jgi:hypothetical protein
MAWLQGSDGFHASTLLPSGLVWESETQDQSSLPYGALGTCGRQTRFLRVYSKKMTQKCICRLNRLPTCPVYSTV